MKYLTVYFIVFVALIVTPFCVAQNGTTNNDAQVSDTADEKQSSLQKGMQPVFDLLHNFLNTIMPYNFYDKSDAPFSVSDVINITKNEDYGQLRERWQDIVKTFGGYAACMICGLLFVVIMPIVGWVYCCCHCCCSNCAGTRERHDPKHAKCKRVTYTSLLLIFTTLMLAGAIITFLGAELLHQSLKNEDNNGLMGGLDTSLGHMQVFINDTLNDIKTEAREKIIDEGLNGILKSITETALTTVDRVKSAINATSLLDQAESIGTVAQTALNDLKEINNSLTKLKEMQANVTTILKDVNSSVETVCGNLCPEIDLSSLSFKPNFDMLDNLNTELNKVQDADNITALVEQARGEFDKVSDSVNSTVANEIDNANKEIDTLTETISKDLDKLDGNSQGFVDAMADGKKFSLDEAKVVRDIGNYIWYTCIGLACAVLLVVLFYYLGVLFGLCGERPTPNAACCNKGTGANLLCTGICCTFMFCGLLMWVVIFTFAFGGLTYSLSCKYLDQGVEHINVFEDVISEGFGWNISQTFNTTNLTISGMFDNCKANQGVYTALNLKYIFDIDTQLNIDAVREEVNKITNATNLNIGDITLLSPDLKTQLEDFTKSNISTVNYTVYIVEVEKGLFGVDLETTITTLNVTANNQNTPPDVKSALMEAVDKLLVVKDDIQPAIEREIGNLKTSVKSLEENSNVTAQISDLIDNIEKSQKEFNLDKNVIVNEQLREAGQGILTSIENTVNSTKDAIKYDIGKCRGLYDAAQAVVHSVCTLTLDPLNAIWFGLGWSLFFYIPSFIFAVLLASLYKRQERYEPYKPEFDDVNTPYSGFDNAYQGGRHEEQFPLTSVDKSRRRDKVGSSNHAYEGRDHESDPRYHRDANPHQGAGREGQGSAYAKPYAGSQDHYDGVQNWS